MTHNQPLKTYKGKFNYQGYIWEGETQARSDSHAFSKLVVGCAKKCGYTSYFMRNYFINHPLSWEIRCQN